jgi:hypothetical protein
MVGFVDIHVSAIVYHYCLNFLFINEPLILYLTKL